MMEILKHLFWSLRKKGGRRQLAYGMVKHCPGELGLILRRRVMRPQFASCGENLTILEGVDFRVAEKMHVGNNVTIGNNCIFQAAAGLTLGDDVMFAPNVMVWTQSHTTERIDIPIREQGNTPGPISIGPDCWFGSNVFVMPGAQMGKGCIVSANSVVGAKKYPDWVILMGNPARVMGHRDKLAEQAEKKKAAAETETQEAPADAPPPAEA